MISRPRAQFIKRRQQFALRLDSLLQEFQFAAAKTGMLPTREVVREVARIFRESELPAPVVDPVMVSSSGMRLMEADALEDFHR